MFVPLPPDTAGSPSIPSPKGFDTSCGHHPPAIHRPHRWRIDTNTNPPPVRVTDQEMETACTPASFHQWYDPQNCWIGQAVAGSRTSDPSARGEEATSADECTWSWPRVVDELIATQWALVNRLGHSALSASRDDTQRILVTGPQRGVGKTTIALTIARWAALTRERVLLVEADFRLPKLAYRLGIAPRQDWRRSGAWKRAVKTYSAESFGAGSSKTALQSNAGLAVGYEDCLVHCSTLPISVLPLATSPIRDLPARNLMEQLMLLMAVAEQEFDCCVIDAGPISELIAQIDSVSRLASSHVVVNSINPVGQTELILACNELWRRGAPSLTIVENQSTTIPA